MAVAAEYNEMNAGTDHITLPYVADEAMIRKMLEI